MDPFVIKRNDTLPALEAVLSDDDGPIDLTSATGANLVVRAAGTDGVLLFKKPCVISEPTLGKVRYEWDVEDTATAGRYVAEIEVLFSGGGVWTFPSVGTIPVTIGADAG